MDELLRDPASWADNVDLAAFFKVLWVMVDWDEQGGRNAWDVLQTRFGWPGRCPEVGDVTNREFDFKHYSRLLKGARLELFDHILEIALCSTGNLFLDMGPDEWDAGMIEPYPYAREKINELRKEWDEAEVRLKEYDQARELVAADPTIYARLAELWEQACRKSELKRTKVRIVSAADFENGITPEGGRPLAEVFAEGGADGAPDPLPPAL
jgi:hypothetical protein